MRSFRVYPNPFNHSFVVESGGTTGETVQAQLYNSVGALLKNIELDRVSGKTVIQVNEPGFYILRVHAKNEVKIFKLVGN